MERSRQILGIVAGLLALLAGLGAFPRTAELGVLSSGSPDIGSARPAGQAPQRRMVESARTRLDLIQYAPVVDRTIIPSLRRQAALSGEWLKARFDRVLPELMRREGIDMWIVVCREHAEDPVYPTLVPYPNMFAWRLMMIVFFDRGGGEGVERIIGQSLRQRRLQQGDRRLLPARLDRPARGPLGPPGPHRQRPGPEAHRHQ